MRHKRSKRQQSANPKKHGQTPPPARQVIYGGHAVIAALQNPRRSIIKLNASENAAHRFAAELKPFGAKLKIAKATDLDRLAGPDAVHQGLVLEAAPLPELNLEQIFERSPGQILLVVLDQITDPHNVGAILRSCAAFGVSAVIVPARNSVEYSGVLAKAASGALEHVPLVRVTNLARTLKNLRQARVSVVGFDSEASEELTTLSTHQRIALIFGAEGKGMRRLTRENCDHLVRLNIPGAIKSLNVSNACAVALYALTAK
jgi:23S rRNA (guanosine2251-2'-O)-methyltransferase